MPASPRICPACSQPIRQRSDWRSVAGVRYHLACYPVAHPGRPPRSPGGRQLLTVRVSDAEMRRYVARAAALGRGLSEHVRAVLDADATPPSRP